MDKDDFIKLLDYIFTPQEVLKCNKIIIDDDIEFTVETEYSNSEETYKIRRQENGK